MPHVGKETVAFGIMALLAHGRMAELAPAPG
jgi:hypothetical protein